MYQINYISDIGVSMICRENAVIDTGLPSNDFRLFISGWDFSLILKI